LTLNIIISFIDILFTNYLRAKESFSSIQIIDLIRIILNPIVTISFILLLDDIIGLAIGVTFVNFIFTSVHFWYAKVKHKFSLYFFYFNFSLFKELFKFSFFIFLNLIIDIVNSNLDNLIIGTFIGTSAVAIYAISLQFNTYYVRLSNIISSVFIPRIHKFINNTLNSSSTELSVLLSKVGRIQFIILFLFLSGFYIFGKQFIVFWIGEEYLLSYYITLILLSSITVDLIQNLAIEIQRGMRKHKDRISILFIMVLVNLFLTILLVRLLGPIGASIGTAIALVFGNGILLNIYYKSRLKLNMTFFWIEIIKLFPGFVVPILSGLIIFVNYTFNNIYELIIGAVIYLVIYLISVYLLSLNKEEIGIIDGLLFKKR
jgi:O-antigen/teichoic acid export membrane protein